MPRVQGDFAQLLHAVASGEPFDPPALSGASSMTVVLAANGYPGTPAKGEPIGGIERAESEGAVVFHAGTAISDGQLVSAGGRVLAVTATGANLAEARDRAYRAVGHIEFADGFCRGDIGWKELERQV